MVEVVVIWVGVSRDSRPRTANRGSTETSRESEIFMESSRVRCTRTPTWLAQIEFTMLHGRPVRVLSKVRGRADDDGRN